MEKSQNIMKLIVDPRRRDLDYSKFFCDVTERWLVAWNQNKHITY